MFVAKLSFFICIYGTCPKPCIIHELLINYDYKNDDTRNNFDVVISLLVKYKTYCWDSIQENMERQRGKFLFFMNYLV